MHPRIEDFLRHLRESGRQETARSYLFGLKQYDAWLRSRTLDLMAATADDLRGFQRYLADEYRGKNGNLLGKGTQATRLSAVKALYSWLHRRGLILIDIGRKVKLPKVAKGNVTSDHLTLQEATALIQTAAQQAASKPAGSMEWASACRDLTLLCMGVATGRRRSGLRNIKLADLEFDHNELRVEKEKGRTGRVLPVADWAMKVTKTYVEHARPVLLNGRSLDWLYVGERSPQVGFQTFNQMLLRTHKLAVEENPDLEELAGKHVTPHSLRVTFATLLFRNGCDIRSVNELMLHDRLTTTSRYTPIPFDDLSRVCRRTHPRA